MDHFLHRYRNVTVLLAAIAAQLALLAYQVRNDQEIRLIRVWAVAAVTPLARVLEATRSSVSDFLARYIVVRDARQENQRLRQELEEARMENHRLRAELNTAERARALSLFQAETPMKTIAARVIGNTTSGGSKEMLVDRGASSGILPGMAVITPSGIAGKITKVFPGTSFVLLITDPNFAAGVVSQKHRVHGTLKGQGASVLRVDNVPNEQTVEPGERFFTAGNDLIFPRGLPVGSVAAVREGRLTKEIVITPSGFEHGLEDVLIITEGVHGEIPPEPVAAPIVLLPPPPPDTGGGFALGPAATGPMSTDADRVTEFYREQGRQQRHVYGERGGGAPDFNRPLAAAPAEHPGKGR
jgi:rod shape-determining protein MreC